MEILDLRTYPGLLGEVGMKPMVAMSRGWPTPAMSRGWPTPKLYVEEEREKSWGSS